MQTADIILYKASKVPVGKDQLPHLELAREIIRKFHHIFNTNIFPEPEAILSAKTSKILGLDGRKMSKSYQNHISLGITEEDLEKKVVKMITDTNRVRLKDPGNPENCNVFNYYSLFASSHKKDVREWCEGALKGCMDCKKYLSKQLKEYLKPINEKRHLWLNDKKKDLEEILQEGAKKARKEAKKTLEEVYNVLSWR